MIGARWVSSATMMSPALVWSSTRTVAGVGAGRLGDGGRAEAKQGKQDKPSNHSARSLAARPTLRRAP